MTDALYELDKIKEENEKTEKTSGTDGEKVVTMEPLTLNPIKYPRPARVLHKIEPGRTFTMAIILP